jgi:hypothetical protein
MKHTSLLSLLTLTAASAMAQSAAPAPALTTSGNLAYTSDYVFRGITQNGGKTAIQGGFDVAHTAGLSAGVWASNVSYGTATLEVDVYAAYGFSLTKDITASVGYIGYIYEGNSATDYFGNSIVGSGTKYYELNYAYDVAAVKGLSLALHYGITDGKNAASTDKDYSIALSYPVLGFTGTLAFSDGSGSYAGTYDGITAVTLKKTF